MFYSATVKVKVSRTTSHCQQHLTDLPDPKTVPKFLREGNVLIRQNLGSC